MSDGSGSRRAGRRYTVGEQARRHRMHGYSVDHSWRDSGTQRPGAHPHTF